MYTFKYTLKEEVYLNVYKKDALNGKCLVKYTGKLMYYKILMNSNSLVSSEIDELSQLGYNEIESWHKSCNSNSMLGYMKIKLYNKIGGVLI